MKPVLTDRVAELGDFISALQEWGCEDPHAMADHIRDFLHSTEGLRTYLEHSLRVIEGGRNGGVSLEPANRPPGEEVE